MDHLRMQSENLLLAFLPRDRREEIRHSWYEGATDAVHYRVDRMASLDHGTQIPFEGDDPLAELLGMLVARSPWLPGSRDPINRCETPPCDRPEATPLERRAERALQRLSSSTGPWVALLPELAFLRVRDPGAAGSSAVYTLIHDRAHTNVAAMFGEDSRLQPEKDTLTIVPGYVGSYPNFVFDVGIDQIENFVQTTLDLREATDRSGLVARYGVRRTSPRFWPTLDWIHADARRRDPIGAGLYDIGRYDNL